MLLIDDRPPPPPPPPERPVWEPDWRTVGWAAAAVAAMIVAGMTSPLVSFVLLCVAVGCGGHAVTRLLPWGDGLREYRQ